YQKALRKLSSLVRKHIPYMRKNITRNTNHERTYMCRANCRKSCERCHKPMAYLITYAKTKACLTKSRFKNMHFILC
ncbi:hypothetical protein L9F63_015349, partial [Diploptera punctata]